MFSFTPVALLKMWRSAEINQFRVFMLLRALADWQTYWRVVKTFEQQLCRVSVCEPSQKTAFRNSIQCQCFTAAGGHGISLGLCPTKLPVIWDIQPGPLDVPAPFLRWSLECCPSCHTVLLFNHNVREYGDIGSTVDETAAIQTANYHTFRGI